VVMRHGILKSNMKTAFVLISLGLLAGCTSVPTDIQYGPAGHVMGFDSGYSELRRGIETWAVRYTGDQYMTGSTVRDLTLLRSAEVTMKAGFSWFVITDKINESGHDLRDTSVSGNHSAQISSGQSSGSTKANPGDKTTTRTANTRFISQYRYEIKCFREAPDIPAVLEAKAVAAELRAKYGIEGSAPIPSTDN